MGSKLQGLIDSNRSRINFLSLAVVQGSNAIFPVILFPYLLMVVGADEFSKIVTSEAVALIVLAISLYGFDVAGIKKLCEIGSLDKSQVKNVFFGILYSRLSIFLACSLFVFLFYLIFSPGNLVHISIWLMLPLGLIIQSSYFYQALEINFVLAWRVVLYRIAACALCILFVKSESDALIGLWIMAGSYFASGVSSLRYFIKVNGWLSVGAGSKYVESYLKECWYFFISSSSVVMYRGCNVIILSVVSGNPAAVSIYAVAEKYVKLVQAVVSPLGQFFFSRVVRELSVAQENNFFIIWRRCKPLIYISSGLMLFFVFFALFEIFFWGSFFSVEMVVLLSIMGFAVPLGVANFFFGTIGMNMLGLDKAFARVALVVGSISMLSAAIAAFYFEDKGVAVVYMLSEALILVSVIFFIRRGAIRD